MRILAAAAFLVVVAAGCGGASRPQRSTTHGVPAALAQGWEGKASAIASAASAGDDCRAQQLAVSLREDVAQSQHKLPLRLRSPLLTGVNSLAARTACPTVANKPTPPKKPHAPPKGPKHKPPKPHGYDKGDDRGHDK